MKPAVRRRQTCRLCDGRRLELVVPLAPTPVAEKYVTADQLHEPTPVFPLDLYQCRDCGHVQLLDIVDERFLFQDFSYTSAGTPALLRSFEQAAARTCVHYRAHGLVVDIGSNDGSLLKCFRQHGCRVVGVDPAAAVAEKAIAAGIPTIVDFLTTAVAEQIRRDHGPAAVVTAFNVYAHTDDLAGMTDCISRLLAPDGLFVFEASYLLDVVDRLLLGTVFHEHMSYHSVKPLAAFLRRHGLELIDIQRNDVQGGSIVGTAQRLGGTRPVSPNVGEIIALETARQLDQPAPLRQFAHRLQRLKEDLARLTAQPGKTFWGFGAARSGTTLIAQMNLGKVIAAIVDDNPAKQGKFSPGDHIPILPTAALYQNRPDYAFLLAWVHAERIIANHQDYLRQGGRFIQCLPQLQLIGPS